MGWELHRVTIHLRTGSHNSWRDDRDDLLAKDLMDQIAAISSNPRYRHILDDYVPYGDVFHPSWMPSPVWTVDLDDQQLWDMQDLQKRK